ncbi:histidine kinase [Paenibacillus sp.]|uniref:sensor histidine kinase n=1 Tax=Paenibacillus sp. TaxID=58172 RepID=UPI0028203DB4|nr:histidine kinase [Paenibacillus sp.]MDR0268746.1 histidine kinase [Paenibacillus sp.]
MKIRFFLNDSSIFKKIMAAFLAALLPLMMITWLINEKGSNNIRRGISESILNMTSFYLDSLDNEADRISRYLPNYVMDKDLMELAATGTEMSYYDRSRKILEIQRRLDLMKNSSPFIQEAKAYVPLLERTILSSKYETSINEPEFKAMQQSAKTYEGPFVYWNDRIFITMQYPATSGKNPTYVVAVELSKKKIQEILTQINGAQGAQSVLLNLDRGWGAQSDKDPLLLKCLTAFATDKRNAKSEEGYETLKYDGKRYLTVYKYSKLWNSYSITCVPEANVLGPLQMYRMWFWVACILAVCIVLLFSYFLLRLIYRPLMKLVHSFRRMRQNVLEPITIDRGADEFGYLYQAFNDTVISLRTLIEENYEQQIRNQRSELKRLQSQINPHFLYNCFFVLCRLIKSENQKEKAYQFCLYIGQYFQFITRNDEDEIPLELEVNHSRTYVDMQTICYGDRIEVLFEGEVPDLFVPRLILQPVIENAYEHAFGNMVQKGELWVHSKMHDDVFSIYVEDNGSNITDEEIEQLQTRLRQSSKRMEETTGIMNVHRRIQLRYGEKYGVTVSRSELGGLQVTINLSAS